MREKMLKIADRLVERADDYEAPYKDTRDDFYLSSAFPIVMALREVATQIRTELKDVNSEPEGETTAVLLEDIKSDVNVCNKFAGKTVVVFNTGMKVKAAGSAPGSGWVNALTGVIVHTPS